MLVPQTVINIDLTYAFWSFVSGKKILKENFFHIPKDKALNLVVVFFGPVI